MEESRVKMERKKVRGGQKVEISGVYSDGKWGTGRTY